MSSLVYDNILQTVGNTPLVKLNKLTRNSPHQFFAKVEYFNPSGSVKDRIALAIIDAAEKRGDLKPGGTIVEATAGNTGMGLALVAAVRGYKCIFVLPEKMSEEKRAMLRAYGAKVVVTPIGVEPDHPLSHYSVARKIANSLPNAFLTNQYHNPDNYDVHYRVTGPEIWEQTKGEVDVFVAGVGTGGTLSGVAGYLKEKKPDIKIVCADPIGSILADLFHHGKIIDPPGAWKVEGVGEDMLPENCHLKKFDDFVKVNDQDSFDMTRKLVTEEGLCVGPSSALILVAAMRYAEKLTKPSKIVVLMPDSGKAYLSKAFNDKWLVENGLAKPEILKTAFNVEVKAEEELKKFNI
ncbi:cysteine synthase family protein [bacterium]|nr:cysteine synthase family protein [bacterium]